jgi:hypothetical protein
MAQVEDQAVTPNGGPAAGRAGLTDDPKVFILSRELSEVHLLLDALSANPNTTLAALVAQAPPADPPTGLPPEWIEQICRISWPPKGSEVDQSLQAALLIKAKDYLNRLSKPASGSTIAFTTLVTQDEDSRRRMWGMGGGDSGIDHTPSRSSLACTAYPDLIPKARTFRTAMRVMAIFLLLWLIVTCVFSWYVAFGNAALGEYAAAEESLQAAQKRVDDAEAAEDDTAPIATTTGGAKTNGAGAATVAASAAAVPGADPAAEAKPGHAAGTSDYEVGYCNRAKLLGYRRVIDGDPLPQYDNIGQMQACQARDVAQANIDRVKRRLANWLWPFGGGPAAKEEAQDEARVKADARAALETANAQPGAAPRRARTADKPGVEADLYADVPSSAASLANIMGSAMLPVIYGILGAGAAIIRSLSRKIRHNLLTPRDLLLSLQQLALGAVVGACIGLFIAQPDSGGGDSAGLLGPVALSGSAISFIAGFGVDSVFQALEALISRIFNIAPAGGQPETK